MRGNTEGNATLIGVPAGAQLLKRKKERKKIGAVGKRTESGSETTRNGDDLARRLIAIKVFWRVFAVDGGSFEGGVVLDDSDRGVFPEQHRFVWWVEVLGR